ncbi:hypothetical protein FGO68_gene5743 [Halteria grandinella]|uniref:Cornichon n=1 Tax=Halteria grandinella TaxID=5974 RepID=A0A8J8NJG1_HALGN|nr:hypothetical protein FGO68_gene5743 [Halteria grandinella]
MQTILWLINLVLTLGCSSSSLYFYLLHDDLDKGIVEPFDLSDQMSKWVPYEIYMHAFITFVMLFNRNWFLFLYNLPLFLVHTRMLINKEHLFHIITVNEYKKDKPKNERFLRIKLAFYVVLFVFILLRFMYAFSNLVIYNIFGKTYTMYFFS